MRILFAESDRSSCEKVLAAFADAKLEVDIADSGHHAIEMLRNYPYGAAIIDLIQPDMDGYDIIKKLRSIKIETPIIIVSSIDKPYAKIKALSTGADDYISNKFDADELVARIKALLRRTNNYTQPVLQVGNLVLDFNTQSVSVDDQMVHLTGKEFAILELLALRKGASLSKETLLNHLYGGRDEPDIKIIDVFVCKLRKKLHAAGAKDLIATIWGRGYVLNDPKPTQKISISSAKPYIIDNKTQVFSLNE
ncbi:response regulator transcription factor [Acetobacter indonesiensis]|uniref:response regulator transcription factor n=1 Tax=Acetobacter indonesiensis TaxID=104101 RepID=UPI0020A2D68B|nr:response regulator transcription factor [Acetobacter indonesiensis]MCP1230036.1 response regulator transcription factor [Acetobacter indonesiensis]